MIYIYFLSKNDIPFYIGKSNNPVRRKHKHYTTYGTGVKLEIIDSCDNDKQTWKSLESYWIDQFTQWGFKLENKNKGGGGPTNYNEESKQKMSKPRKEGTGLKISNTLKNNNHSKYYTQVVKDKMSKKLKGISKKFTEEHKINLAKANLKSKGKIVECYTLSGDYMLSFSCLREAAEWLIKDQPNISKNVAKQIKDCCNGRQKKCHGYFWKYK